MTDSTHDISFLFLPQFPVSSFQFLYRLAQQPREVIGNGINFQSRNNLSIGTAHVRHQNHFRAFFGQIFDGREGRVKPCVVQYLFSFEWDIKINADENAFAREIPCISNKFHTIKGVYSLKKMGSMSTSP